MPKAPVCLECGGAYAPAMTPGALGEKRLYLPQLRRNTEDGCSIKPAIACVECGLVKERPITTMGHVLSLYTRAERHLPEAEHLRIVLLIREYWNEHYKAINRANSPPHLLHHILSEVGEDLNVRLTGI